MPQHGYLASALQLLLIASVFALTVISGCRQQTAVTVPDSRSESKASGERQPVAQVTNKRSSNKYPQLLSDYKLYRGELAKLEPSEGVVEYDLNTPLFSDYSGKQRLLWLPPGTSAEYQSFDAFEFPVSTVISKTFYYAQDMNDSTRGRRLIETRILKRTDDGWIGLPYVWNDEQTEATLSLAGAAVDVEWIDEDGVVRNNTHLVPNLNDCKRCHQNASMAPLGPNARNLNRDFEYAHGTENQLSYWTRMGHLSDAPKPEETPRLAVWNDPRTGTLDERARAWLEVNCAHCHNPNGPARNSGLNLNIDVTDRYQIGILKTPVAAGKGTGGRNYSIVPGKPDESIMLYRLETTQPGALMPEFGRTVVHHESVALIREWIESLSSDQANRMLRPVPTSGNHAERSE